MKFVIFDSIYANGLESPEADVEGDLGDFGATLADAIEDFWSEVKASGGSGDRSVLLGVNGLVAIEIARRIGAHDVGRKRDVADPAENGKEVVFPVILVMVLFVMFSRKGLKANAAFAELGTGENFSLQFVVLSEKKAFAYANLASGANQTFPIVGVGGKLAREQDLNPSLQKVARSGIVRADRLRASAFAATVEPRRKDAGVVEDDEIAGTQQIGEIAEQAIRVLATGSLKMQHAGAVAGGERFLGDEFFGEMKVEVGDQHRARL